MHSKLKQSQRTLQHWMCRWGVRLLVIVLSVLCWHANADAAGFYLAPQGVRPLARGGAFVAGSDDVHALNYNPAGLALARNQILLDAGVAVHETLFARALGASGQLAAQVRGRGMMLPSPTLGAVWDVGLQDRQHLKIAASLSSEYPLLQNWPSPVEDPLTAQRYAIGSFTGTAMLKLGLGVGYQPIPWMAMGASLHLLTGTFGTQTAISTCDGVICTAPEDPQYDAIVQMRTQPIASFGASLGLMFFPAPWLRWGFAWQSGYRIHTDATLNVRLPLAALYANATLVPAQPTASVRMRLPQVARMGVEGRWWHLLRVELDFVFEPWSVHDNIQIGLHNAAIEHVAAIGRYPLQDMSILRGFKDTWSVRLGAELSPPLRIGRVRRPLSVRLGAIYEPSAIPDAMLTAMSVDLDKVLLTTGVAWQWQHIAVEVSLAQILMWQRRVQQSQMYQINPTASPSATTIGNGLYEADATWMGLGVRYFF